MGRLLAVTLALPLLASGCRSTPQIKGFQYRADVKPADYFPLALGTVWSYRATIAGGPSDVLVISRVASRVGTRAMLSDDLGYNDEGDTLYRLPSGTPVLKTPIAAAASWPVTDGIAKIVSIDAVVVTPGGSYASCVVVEELMTDRRRVVSYAPGVGPVREEIYARDPAGETLISRTLLQSYNPASPEGP